MIELCLASVYTEKINPTGWYVSDKLDGIRCQWTGKEMYTRNGKLLTPPSFFVAELPASPLDGELYVPENILSELSKGRSVNGLKFDTHSERIVREAEATAPSKTRFSPSSILMSIISSQDELGWLLLTYWVFDAPAISMPFKHRLSSLSAYFSSSPKTFVRLLPFSAVKDNADVKARLESSVFEGLVLRNPNSMYERKRCWSMVKVKKTIDAEFEVAGVCTHPFGKHPKQAQYLRKANRGRIAVVLKTITSPHREFVLVNGITKATREECLKAKEQGRLVTVKFNGYDHKGIPRQPVYMRVQLTL